MIWKGNIPLARAIDFEAVFARTRIPDGIKWPEVMTESGNTNCPPLCCLASTRMLPIVRNCLATQATAGSLSIVLEGFRDCPYLLKVLVGFVRALNAAAKMKHRSICGKLAVISIARIAYDESG